MWILILSMAIWPKSVAVTTQPDFESYAACAKAGEVFIKQHRRDAYADAKWSCVLSY